MKCIIIAILTSLMFGEAIAQMPPSSKMESTTTSSKTIKGRSYLEPSGEGAEEKKSEVAPTPPRPQYVPPVMQPQKADYFHPGILVNINGKWEGSDHLLNITKQIGVNVSIVKPEDQEISVTDREILKEVEAIFAKAGIVPQALASPKGPALPVFDILIIIYPIDRGFVCCVEGRLFESVILDRFKMDANMAFQAITWEKHNLIVFPTAQLTEQLTKTVREIATSFGERYQTFERYKRGP